MRFDMCSIVSYSSYSLPLSLFCWINLVLIAVCEAFQQRPLLYLLPISLSFFYSCSVRRLGDAPHSLSLSLQQTLWKLDNFSLPTILSSKANCMVQPYSGNYSPPFFMQVRQLSGVWWLRKDGAAVSPYAIQFVVLLTLLNARCRKEGAQGKS